MVRGTWAKLPITVPHASVTVQWITWALHKLNTSKIPPAKLVVPVIPFDQTKLYGGTPIGTPGDIWESCAEALPVHKFAHDANVLTLTLNDGDWIFGAIK